jgi:hypothetical protein
MEQKIFFECEFRMNKAIDYVKTNYNYSTRYDGNEENPYILIIQTKEFQK